MDRGHRQRTLTVRLDDESHDILCTLARVRGQNKTQVLKRMLREEMARESLLSGVESFLNKRLSEIASDRCLDLAEGIEE